MAVAAAVIGAVAALTTTAISVANYEDAQDAAAAQKDLVKQQNDKLAEEAHTRDAQAALQASTGSVFGRGDSETTKSLSTGFGFGSAPTASPNTGRGQITGGF